MDTPERLMQPQRAGRVVEGPGDARVGRPDTVRVWLLGRFRVSVERLSGHSRPRLAERAKIVHLCDALVYTGGGTFSGLGKGRDCWDNRRAPNRPTLTGDSEDRLRESRGWCELLRTPLWRSSQNTP